MALNPLNVLKRRLEDENTPITKRLCLARNVVKTFNFPTVPKEKIVAEWLESIVKENKVDKEEFKKLLTWAVSSDELTADLKSILIQITASYLQTNSIQNEDIPTMLSFIQNNKIMSQLNNHVGEFIFIIKTLLKHLSNDIPSNLNHVEKIMNGLVKFYKDTKKKLEFVVKILEGDNIETIFSYLDNTETRGLVAKVCQSILFPINKKSFFVVYLRTLLQKENMDKLMAEKGDNIQSVLKVMNAFFSFPSGRTNKDHNFIRKYIEIFVSSFKGESQLIFAFYIMVGSSLSFDQDYMSPSMKMTPISFQENDEKIKRSLFLNMLQTLIDNEIDVNVRLTDTLGSESKAETKKTFSTYLQAIMMSQLKLEGKVDKTTLQIIKTTLKLDPTIVDKKLDVILPPIMAAKKNSSNINEYVDMLNNLHETLFKLSRGTTFLTQILPHLQSILEASNTEQQKMITASEENKIITQNDVFPNECTDFYGKLASELMNRQSSDLLVLLVKEFEKYCLLRLDEGNASPSIITLTEVIAAILSSFFQKTKMADHAVPKLIADDYWEIFGHFEYIVLKLFGECVLNLNNNRLTRAFLQLCKGVAELKLLNIQYSNVKVIKITLNDTSEVSDLSGLLPSITSQQWTSLWKNNDAENTVLLNDLLLLKLIATQILSPGNTENLADETKTHLIKEISGNPELLASNNLQLILFANLDSSQTKQLSKILIKTAISNTEILKSEAVANNKALLNTLTFEVLKNITKITDDNGKLRKAMGKSSFDVAAFISENPEYFESLCNNTYKTQNEELLQYLDILKMLQIYYLEENTQLTAILLLLSLKKSDAKKVRRSVDVLLQSIFELSTKCPDLYKIFSADKIFDFETKNIIDLLTLKIKTINQFLIMKCVLESAVKKIKMDPELLKIIVKILLTNQKVKKEGVSNMDYFTDEVFQISCLILPIIAKEKRAITASVYRTILAEHQEKLHKSLLKSFKSINFENEKGKMLQETGNTEGVSDNLLATLNATEAFSLTLSKYCETTDAEEIKNLDCLWNGLEYFVQSAILSLQNRETKPHHVDSALQLLNVVLRHIKKLDTHSIFEQKDKIFFDIWKSVKERLFIIFEDGKYGCLDEISVTIKFLSEIVSMECFVTNFVGDLFSLLVPKKQQKSKKEDKQNQTITSLRVAKHLYSSCLKSNIVGPKCLALSKATHRTVKNLSQWIRQMSDFGREEMKIVKIDEETCDVIKIDLEVICDVILAAKKIPLDYKSMDALFELQQSIHCMLGGSVATQYEVSWTSYFKLFSGCVGVLQCLVVARDELLEDRWPNFFQCYRTLVTNLCEKSTSQVDLDKSLEDRLAELAHSVEKLTQIVSKKKTHISRLASYTVGDLCSSIEKNAPNRLVRQHIENSVAFLIQASDSAYSIGFLKRALAGAPGQITMTNLYTMYKRYHKYVGNA